jgi:ribosomal protein L16 Arg81 hydroxylase
MTGSLELKHLLSPIPVESFFRDTWENEPLVVRRDDRKHYAGLLALEDIDQIIAFSRPKFGDQGAFQNPVSSRPTYVRGTLDPPSHAFAENPGIAEIRQVFDDGKSIVIMALQHRWQAVAALCRNLEAVFHCPVHANMYLTPAGSQGFAAHFDTHEVFILQLQGTKHWRLYGAAEELPLVSENVGIPKRPLGPSQEVCLEAGDFLYIPRGHVHEAFTTDSLSLHLTVGINVYRWADLLRHAVAAASRLDVRFRRALPGGALPGDQAALKKEFANLLALLADESTAEHVFERALRSLGDQFFGQLHTLPANHFSSPSSLEAINLDTVLERPAATFCRVIEDEMGVAIEFPGSRVGGPHRVVSALRFVAGNSRFAVRALPDDLNADAKIVLMRRLVREGLLTIVHPVHDATRANGAVLQSHAATEWEALETEREMQGTRVE